MILFYNDYENDDAPNEPTFLNYSPQGLFPKFNTKKVKNEQLGKLINCAV